MSGCAECAHDLHDYKTCTYDAEAANPMTTDTTAQEAAASASDLDAATERVIMGHRKVTGRLLLFAMIKQGSKEEVTGYDQDFDAAVRSELKAYGEQQRRQGAEDERYKVLRDFRVLAAYHAQREAEAKKEVTT